MITIRPAQLEPLEAVAQSNFVRSLTGTLERLVPESAAEIRARGDAASSSDPFAEFVAECVLAAEEIDIEDDADIAVFATVVTLADRHAESHPDLFNHAFHALAREGPGRLRIAMIDDRFSEVAGQRPGVVPLRDTLAAAREAFA